MAGTQAAGRDGGRPAVTCVLTPGILAAAAIAVCPAQIAYSVDHTPGPRPLAED